MATGGGWCLEFLPHSKIMRAKAEQQIGYVQQRVANGNYRVDSQRIAAAMLQRIGALALGREISVGADRGRSQATNGHPEA